jgi:hypothetical protein
VALAEKLARMSVNCLYVVFTGVRAVFPGEVVSWGGCGRRHRHIGAGVAHVRAARKRCGPSKAFGSLRWTVVGKKAAKRRAREITAVTLRSGFKGGEVTPLFFIGAALGCTLGRLLGLPTDFMAALGFVGVFAASANTPLACTIMGIATGGYGKNRS